MFPLKTKGPIVKLDLPVLDDPVFYTVLVLTETDSQNTVIKFCGAACLLGVDS